MDEICAVLQRFHVNDNEVQEQLVQFFLSHSSNPEMYVVLFQIATSPQIAPALRVCALIQLRNMCRLSEFAVQIISQVLPEHFGKVDDVSLPGFCRVFSMVFNTEQLQLWFQCCQELGMTGNIGFLVPLFAISRQKTDCGMQMLPILIQMTQMTGNVRIIAIKIILNLFKSNCVPPESVEYLLTLCAQTVGDLPSKSIALMTAILRSNLPVAEFDKFLSACLSHIEIPNVAIRLFDMLVYVARNPSVSGIITGSVSEMLGNVFVPFFAVKSIEDFILEHDFDSFSARDDPRAAAYRCLESLSFSVPGFAAQIVTIVMTLDDTPENFYLKCHIISSVFKGLSAEQATQIVQNFVGALSMPNELVLSGVLVILRRSNVWSGQAAIVNRCIELLKEDSFVAYFAAKALMSIVDCQPELSDEHVAVIVDRAVGMSASMGSPELLSLVSLVFDRQIEIVIPMIPVISQTSIAMIHFSVEMEYVDVSLHPIYNILMLLLEHLQDHAEVEAFLCQYLAENMIPLVEMNSVKTLTTLLFEVLCNVCFYSPAPLDPLWYLFPVIGAKIAEMDSAALETGLKLLSNVIVKSYITEERAGIVAGFMGPLLSCVTISECAYFVAVVMKVFPCFEQLCAAAVTEMVKLWSEEEPNVMEEFMSIFTVLVRCRMDLIAPVLHQFPQMLECVLDSCGPGDLIAILPPLMQIIQPDMFVDYVNQLRECDRDKLASNSFDLDEDLEVQNVKTIDLFDLDELIREFMNNIK